jgi:hypothetical protein
MLGFNESLSSTNRRLMERKTNFANKANIVVVVGTTASWAPALGGNTTFNNTLTVTQSPFRAKLALALQGIEVILSWKDGGPSYRVQRATDLDAGDWTDLQPNATPPVTPPPAGQAAFHRIVGR